MGFLLRRLALLVPVLLVVSFLTFMLMTMLPGGPEVNFLGPQAVQDLSICDDPELDLNTRTACEDTIKIREELNLDDPLLVRYFTWLGNAVQGDFGDSVITGVPVSQTISERLPTSIALMLYAQAIALLIAIPVGIISAYRANGVVDKSTTGLSFALIALPSFVLALVLLFIFGNKLGWFPTRYDIDAAFRDKAKAMFLPALTLGLGLAAVYQRLLRTDLVATLHEDFIFMAKAKGIPARRILFRHALRPSMFSLITVVGIQVGALIGGAIVVEQIFLVPGLGLVITEGILRREFQIVQASVLVITFVYVMVNFVVDILYGFLDPRVRHARSAR